MENKKTVIRRIVFPLSKFKQETDDYLICLLLNFPFPDA